MILHGIHTAMTEIQVDAFDSLIDYFRVTTFIELGTYKGGLTNHLIMRRDNPDKRRFYDQEFNYYGFEFDPGVIEARMRKHIIVADVSHPPVIERIRGLVNLSSGPVIIFCDTFDKPREMLTYGKLLRVMDMVIGHDYPGEVSDEFLNQYGIDNPNFQEIGGPTYRSQGYSAWIRIK